MRAGLLSLAIALAFPSTPVLAHNAAPATFNFATAPGRLPKNVVPIEYTIAITPDAAAHTIAGAETILLDFREATATIQFNSLNQKLSKVLLDGKPVQDVVSDDDKQLTTITLAQPAKAGTHTLSLYVVALPLKGVLLSYNDSNAAREVKGTVERRGLWQPNFAAGE